MQLKRYRLDLDYSYAFGLHPVLELLRFRSQAVRRVVAHSRGAKAGTLVDVERRCESLGIGLEVDDALVERLSHKRNVDVLAVFEKYVSELSRDADHVMLVTPSDHGNVGTTLRSMAAFGFREVALVGSGTDMFNPHVVRASMGMVFACDGVVFEAAADYLGGYQRRLYRFTAAARRTLRSTVFESPLTLAFGPEGGGYPESLRRCGQEVAIPQRPEVESLNLAVASGIALYEVATQRAAAR